MHEEINNLKSYHYDSTRSKNKLQHKEYLVDKQAQENISEIKQQNAKIKKMLKQAQAKRTQITKQCSEINKQNQILQNQNLELRRKLQDGEQKNDNQKYRIDELRFLNKQLTSQIQQLRNENQQTNQKLRYSNEILERKYEQLEQKTFKRIQQAMKRVKKAIHYLQSLTARQIDKTREILIDNLKKANELLRGKYNDDDCDEEIQELMNPLKNMQEQISTKHKEINLLKSQNARLTEELDKYKNIEKQHLPIYKDAIQKLKKNLIQVRSQLSQNQYDKIQIKKKYEEKIKESEYKYNQLYKEFRKMKLEKKIYQNKLEELEADVEQEKQRLLGQNEMLKKLYKNNEDQSYSRISEINDYKSGGFSKDKKTIQKQNLKKNYSSSELKGSQEKLANSDTDFYGSKKKIEISGYNEESSMLSQQSLKHQICKIDEQIMQIQKNLAKELDAYR